jgi:hypothetical protein
MTTTLMLNDVPADTRLAYLLGPTRDRSQRRGSSPRVVTLAVLGAATLLLFFLWHVPRGYGQTWAQTVLASGSIR